ncbi:cytochrome c biogenesis protein CcsA [Cyclonatronum proteinivorum]|uniref:cytochrome c biogenesis protein CcsA n=1 Tax=Cyclonatronum proteinivorum TaxID=1457365 RepID=UPI001F0CAE14|nr:cytochrome c biogenesis protein CcsA [Cyclonatronum proteinivorum]
MVLTWLTVVIAAAFLVNIPQIAILEETARNLIFHVPMWFTMFAAFAAGMVYSIRYLWSENPGDDLKAESASAIGVVFGICGLLTGMVWARFTWGAWWTFAEPKMNLSAIALLIYVAYFILRSSFDDPQLRARLSAVYNIFAASTIPFLMYVIPRQLPSLHPGADGNPAFSEFTAIELRIVFYPAILGFFALAYWMTNLRYRYRKAVLTLETRNTDL